MSKLLEKTTDLLRKSKQPLEQIAVNTQINYHTLQKLRGYASTKSIPSVETCERLYVYLSGKELEL